MKRLMAVWVVCFSAAAGDAVGLQVAAAAKAQIGVTNAYDPSYKKLAFPNGDIPLNTGVCADVVVRALRAVKLDLQAEVNQDMKGHFSKYPQTWGLKKPDANIDHRRVLNLMTFFTRRGLSVGISEAYAPGDVVAWRLNNGLYHIGIVAAEKGATDLMVIHNIGRGAKGEDVLRAWTIVGHYRVPELWSR